MGSRALTDALRGRWRVRAPRRFGGYFRNDADHRDYVSIGTAAGAPLAARAPLLRCRVGLGPSTQPAQRHGRRMSGCSRDAAGVAVAFGAPVSAACCG